MGSTRRLSTVSLAILIAGALTSLGSAAASPPKLPDAARAVPTNINISKQQGNQSESTIAINPLNRMQMTVVSNEASIAGMFHGWSTDGGRTWSTDVIADGDNLGTACCDPSLASDSYGNIFLTWLSSNIQVFVALSTDGGASFNKIAAISPGHSEGAPAFPGRGIGRLPGGDQPSVVAGENSVWVTYTSNNGNIVAQGASVTGLGQVGQFGPQEAPSGGHKTGGYGDVGIGPSGQVLIAWQDPTGGEGPATVFQALDPDGLGPQAMGPSTPVLVSNVGGFDYIPAQAGRSVDIEVKLEYDRTGGTHDGRVYLLWTQEVVNENDDTEIMVQFSDDDGSAWSTAVRVNDDIGTNSQFNPRMALDPTTGFVAVAWYDARNDLGNHGPGDTNGLPNDDAMIYGSFTKDGGLTFEASRRISKGVSNSADSNNFIDFGDYEGLAYFGGVYFYVWADNSNSTGDNPDGKLHELYIYTARVRAR